MSSLEVCRKSIGEKLVLAGGAATLALASGTAAEAAVVSAQGTPISPPGTFGVANWDIDGDSTTDFTLQNKNFAGYVIGVLNEINGGRFVAASTVSSGGVAKLSSGFEVGPSMPGFQFFNAAQTQITATWGGTVAGDLGSQGWSTGDIAFFGFKFTSGGNTYYGWGELDLHGGTPGSGFTITQAYYENTPGATITVGDTGSAVPEPSSCALALLAAGGVAAYRSRRKKAAL